MDDLFNASRDVSEDVFRNIVSLRPSIDFYDELTAGDPELATAAAAAESRVKEEMPPGLIERGFHYTTAITYPFESEPYLMSRYGDGTYGVWYGSLDTDTTVAETAHHMIQDEGNIEGLDEVVIRERAVYAVFCRAVLLDISAKGKSHPGLIAEDYGLTHQIGYRLHREGQPGLLAPSARRRTGINTVIFNRQVLNDPRRLFYLTYRFDPRSRTVEVEREAGEVYVTYPAVSAT